jgi:hypothetical protein
MGRSSRDAGRLQLDSQSFEVSSEGKTQHDIHADAMAAEKGMTPSGEGNVLFRYQSRSVATLLYLIPLPLLLFAYLYLQTDSANIQHYPGISLLLAAAQSGLLLCHYLNVKSYKIVAGPAGLMVSSLFASREVLYKHLRKVHLKPLGRSHARYALEVINDEGSPVIKVSGEKPLMENLVSALNARISTFGLAGKRSA